MLLYLSFLDPIKIDWNKLKYVFAEGAVMTAKLCLTSKTISLDFSD